MDLNNGGPPSPPYGGDRGPPFCCSARGKHMDLNNGGHPSRPYGGDGPPPHFCWARGRSRDLAPLSHFWLFGVEIWHPSHTFGSLESEFGTPLTLLDTQNVPNIQYIPKNDPQKLFLVSSVEYFQFGFVDTFSALFFGFGFFVRICSVQIFSIPAFAGCFSAAGMGKFEAPFLNHWPRILLFHSIHI